MKAKQPRPVVVDFETQGIKSRPSYPPVPVGVSIKWPGKKAIYHSWGHFEGNTCSWDEARELLLKAWSHADGVLFQNGKFDVDVAEVHLNLPPPPWEKIHDTLFLLFLDDPHQIELGLKPSAERLLGLPPEEQDAVGEWLIRRQPVPGVKISRSKQSEHYFGRYISLAPASLVGPYANGDTDRTEQIFNLLWPKTRDREMLRAYDRERELMPVLLDMERRGLPVDLERLRDDVALYSEWKLRIEAWIIKRLKAAPDINLDSGEQLVAAMVDAGRADPDLMPRTPTGRFQTNKEALLLGVTDKVLLAILKYRVQLKTCLGTFMGSWLRTAEETDGLIFTTWNQTKSTESGGSIGTRTGRLSSNPNFQNIPKEFKPIFAHEETNPVKTKSLPASPFKDLPPLPQVRSYVVASKGNILCGRDFSSQELRILAYFEDGSMKASYHENPTVDLHQYAADLITSTTGVIVTRSAAKNIAFSILYGSGLGKLAMGVGCSVDDAGKLRNAYLGTFPGIKEIQKDLKMRAKAGLPVKTWGGREYYCEEPRVIEGRLRSFDYKMLNYIIQGSSADQTKEAVIRYARMKKHGHLLLLVHDEVVIQAPEKHWMPEMAILKEAMTVPDIDVPMISDGERGFSWTEMEACD